LPRENAPRPQVALLRLCTTPGQVLSSIRMRVFSTLALLSALTIAGKRSRSTASPQQRRTPPSFRLMPPVCPKLRRLPCRPGLQRLLLRGCDRRRHSEPRRCGPRQGPLCPGASCLSFGVTPRSRASFEDITESPWLLSYSRHALPKATLPLFEREIHAGPSPFRCIAHPLLTWQFQVMGTGRPDRVQTGFGDHRSADYPEKGCLAPVGGAEFSNLRPTTTLQVGGGCGGEQPVTGLRS
jgi:hypothetical protein